MDIYFTNTLTKQKKNLNQFEKMRYAYIHVAQQYIKMQQLEI